MDASRTELEHLLDVAGVHHLPLMDGDRVVGLWLATTGGIQLLGPGRRETRPVVIRLVGPAEAGKTTLLIRTLSLLSHCEAAVEAQLVLIEDVATLTELGKGAIDDLQVPVVPAGREDRISRRRLRQAAAVVLTWLDVAPRHFGLDGARDWLRSTNPDRAVFGTAARHDDRGLAEWADWIERRALTLGR